MLKLREKLKPWFQNILGAHLEENPAVAKKIVAKAIDAQRARLAAKKAREITREKMYLSSVLFQENWLTVRNLIRH
ncbi:MAG: hypothetical protein Ct9H300mP21_10670 [Pseudomonadota bacterium]|nr:MAG: hypothetical protein Ct9H300mP21_10670 [Pseudomonadota bacterium]